MIADYNLQLQGKLPYFVPPPRIEDDEEDGTNEEEKPLIEEQDASDAEEDNEDDFEDVVDSEDGLGTGEGDDAAEINDGSEKFEDEDQQVIVNEPLQEEEAEVVSSCYCSYQHKYFFFCSRMIRLLF